jgi:general secretion pathway protein D
MTKSNLKICQAIALALALSLVMPVMGFAADGKKHFKSGLKYEENRQWDEAAKQFALAVAEKPSNIEYQLHLQRALVNAAVMLVERGDRLAEQKDYNAAYNAYRQAFAFDRSNELALVKMRRMLESQGLPIDSLPKTGDPAGPKWKKSDATNLKANFPGAVGVSSSNIVNTDTRRTQLSTIPGRKFNPTDVIYRDTALPIAIEKLAEGMRLNVIFDSTLLNQIRNTRINVELRDVTAPRALEMILKTHNLMYAQLDKRTIVVATDNAQSRFKYEPFALRTFYVKHADVNEVRGAIQSTLQAKNMTILKQLNALIVRDTPANLELVEAMINSLDKEKAEVLIDVNIYEVSRNDLLQIGNQFNLPGDSGQQNRLNLGFLGGIEQERGVIAGGPARMLTGPLGFALGIPPSLISVFQDKGKSKLLASTQVHILDNESNQVRIGQRVPIQTASLPSFSNVSPREQRRANEQAGIGGNNDIFSGVGGAFLGGIPQIQYENVGLNIDIKPAVFEDEVQMDMSIESTSVDTSTGKLTPTFNQRTLKSKARVKDGQVTLIAGVSQDVESKNIRGLPLIGLIPILGRFFATPETINRQSDVVITVTPHILRRADIREEDHLAVSAGDQQSSTAPLKIEQILYLADIEDSQQNQVAAGSGPAGANGSTATPAQPNNTTTGVVNTGNPARETPGVVVSPVPIQPASQPAQSFKPDIQRSQVEKPGATPASQRPPQPQDDDEEDDEEGDDEEEEDAANLSPVTVSVRPASPVAVKGQAFYVAVILNGNAEMSGATISFNYDATIFDVQGVRDSGLLRAGGTPPELQFTAENGSLNIQLLRPQGTGGVPARGQLLLIVLMPKGQGKSPLEINEQQTLLRTPSGQNIPIRVHSSSVEVR